MGDVNGELQLHAFWYLTELSFHNLKSLSFTDLSNTVACNSLNKTRHRISINSEFSQKLSQRKVLTQYGGWLSKMHPIAPKETFHFTMYYSIIAWRAYFDDKFLLWSRFCSLCPKNKYAQQINTPHKSLLNSGSCSQCPKDKPDQ